MENIVIEYSSLDYSTNLILISSLFLGKFHQKKKSEIMV